MSVVLNQFSVFGFGPQLSSRKAQFGLNMAGGRVVSRSSNSCPAVHSDDGKSREEGEFSKQVTKERKYFKRIIKADAGKNTKESGSPVADAPRKLSRKRKKGDDECQPTPPKLPDNISIHGCAASHEVEVQSFQLVATSENGAMGPEKMSTTGSPKDGVEAERIDASPEVPVNWSIASSDNAKDLEEDEQEEVQSITSDSYVLVKPIKEAGAVPVMGSLSTASSDNSHNLEEDEQKEATSDSYVLIGEDTSTSYASTTPIPEVEAERIDTSSSTAISDDAHKSEEDKHEEAQSTTSDSYLLSSILKVVSLPWRLFSRARIGAGTARRT
eukprot:XP_019074063.1 PREDICTED: uncharacterized protein LOC104878318 isoform X2 [Vitis vinifera]